MEEALAKCLLPFIYAFLKGSDLVAAEHIPANGLPLPDDVHFVPTWATCAMLSITCYTLASTTLSSDRMETPN